jgi:hypothetical protein
MPSSQLTVCSGHAVDETNTPNLAYYVGQQRGVNKTGDTHPSLPVRTLLILFMPRDRSPACYNGYYS